MTHKYRFKKCWYLVENHVGTLALGMPLFGPVDVSSILVHLNFNQIFFFWCRGHIIPLIGWCGGWWWWLICCKLHQPMKHFSHRVYIFQLVVVNAWSIAHWHTLHMLREEKINLLLIIYFRETKDPWWNCLMFLSYLLGWADNPFVCSADLPSYELNTWITW